MQGRSPYGASSPAAAPRFFSTTCPDQEETKVVVKDTGHGVSCIEYQFSFASDFELRNLGLWQPQISQNLWEIVRGTTRSLWLPDDYRLDLRRAHY